METLLWKAACSIRGEKDAPNFKDYILPSVFVKRLSDVFEDEIARLTEEFGDEKTAHTVLDADLTLVRFYILPRPPGPWSADGRRSTGRRIAKARSTPGLWAPDPILAAKWTGAYRAKQAPGLRLQPLRGRCRPATL